MDFLYRYVDVQYAAPLDEYEQPVGAGHVAVELAAFRVLRSTPKGEWISVDGLRRFVRRDATKLFAAPTKQAALDSFLARKRRQLRILSAQARRVELAISRAAAMKGAA